MAMGDRRAPRRRPRPSAPAGRCAGPPHGHGRPGPGAGGAAFTACGAVSGQPLILAAYTDNAEVAAVAATLLQVIPCSTCATPMQCINSYLLRAYKVAVVPLVLQVVALGLFGLGGG